MDKVRFMLNGRPSLYRSSYRSVLGSIIRPNNDVPSTINWSTKRNMARRFFLHLYMLRVPFLTLVVLGLALPETFASTLFRGLADLEFNQILVVSLGAFLLVSAAMTCAFLVLMYGTERADGIWPPMETNFGSGSPAIDLSDASVPRQNLALSGWQWEFCT